MSTLYLIRYASHDWLGQKLAGWLPGVHLNERGRAEADGLADRLANSRIEAVYSSPLERSLETATPIAARSRTALHVVEALGEVRCGAWSGRTFQELSEDPAWNAFNRCPTTTIIPGGESMLEVQARAVSALERIRARHPHGRVAVVSHGDVLRAAIAHYLGLSLDMMLRFDVDPASVSALHVEGHGALLKSLNELPEQMEAPATGAFAHPGIPQ